MYKVCNVVESSKNTWKSVIEEKAKAAVLVKLKLKLDVPPGNYIYVYKYILFPVKVLLTFLPHL